MISAGCQIENRKHIGCLSRACKHCSGSAFKCRNLAGNIVIGRVLKSGIEISAGLQIEELTHIFTGVILKSSALNNGYHTGFAVFRFVSCLNTFSFLSHLSSL